MTLWNGTIINLETYNHSFDKIVCNEQFSHQCNILLFKNC